MVFFKGLIEFIKRPYSQIEETIDKPQPLGASVFILILGILNGLMVMLAGLKAEEKLKDILWYLVTHLNILLGDVIAIADFTPYLKTVNPLKLFLMGLVFYLLTQVAFVVFIWGTGKILENPKPISQIVMLVGYSKVYLLIGLLFGGIGLLVHPLVVLIILAYASIVSGVFLLLALGKLFRNKDGFIYLFPTIVFMTVAISLALNYRLMLELYTYACELFESMELSLLNEMNKQVDSVLEFLSEYFLEDDLVIYIRDLLRLIGNRMLAFADLLAASK